MADSSIKRDIWATIDDTYDHDTVRFGPFPDLAAAHHFCDAKNRQIIETVRQEIGHQTLLELLAEGNRAFGGEANINRHEVLIGLKLQCRLGCWAHCLDYDQKKTIAKFILHPQADCIDAETEARALGCKWEYEWLRETRNHG
ncbi:MAG: hypothetical protein HXX17_16625 [Geobacteraceae bacterium]|nr:hypothetical protein [Geobacteraceae bacterium]